MLKAKNSKFQMFDMTGEQVRKMKGNYNYFLDTSVI